MLYFRNLSLLFNSSFDTVLKIMHYHSFIPFQNAPEVGKNEAPTIDPIDTTAESATTESLVKGGSSGGDEGIGATVRVNDNAMIAIVNEPSSQAHAGGVSVSGNAISSKKRNEEEGKHRT